MPVSMTLRNRLPLIVFPFSKDATVATSQVLAAKLSKYTKAMRLPVMLECDMPRSWMFLSGILKRKAAVKNIAHRSAGSQVLFNMVFILELKST
jgi:hypothetical protein